MEVQEECAGQRQGGADQARSSEDSAVQGVVAKTPADASSSVTVGSKTERDPLLRFVLDRYISVYVHWPNTCGFVGCVLIFLLGVISLLVGGMNMTLGVKSAWQVHRGEFTLSATALEQARNDLEPEGLLQEQPEETKSFIVMYKRSTAGTVFTPASLRDMCLLERAAATSSICARASCIKYSAVRAFYSKDGSPFGADGWDYDWSCEELSQSHVDSVVSKMFDSTRLAGTDSPFSAILHPEFPRAASATVASSPMTRAEFTWRDVDDEKIDDVVLGKTLKGLDPPREYGILTSPFEGEDDRFLPYGSTLRVRFIFGNEFMMMLPVDLGLAVFAIVFVHLTIWAHTGSLFLASFGMFQIIWSLLVSGLFYQKVFAIAYFEFLHVLIVYLVLGIGADDIFVLVDTFRHIKSSSFATVKDGCLSEEDLHVVLRDTWLRASTAVFNTSFTTAMAFASCSFSKVMPVRTAAWYAAICICMNFIFAITFTPALLAIQHYRFEGKRCCCACPSPVRRSRGEFLPRKSATVEADSSHHLRHAGLLSVHVDWFLNKVYLPAMGKTVGFMKLRVKPIPLALFVVLLGVAIQGMYFTMQLTPPSKVEIWFPSNHMSNNVSAFMIENSYMPNHDAFAEMQFYWGISGIDFSDFDEYDPDNTMGGAKFDDSFDLSTSEAQRALLETCRLLRSLRCDVPGCKNAGYGKLVFQKGEKMGVSCFLESFLAWYQNETNSTALPTGPAFERKLSEFHQRAQDSGGLEVFGADYKRDIGFLDGRLRYVVVRIRSTLPKEEPYSSGVDVRKVVVDFMQQRKDASPACLKSLRLSCDVFRGYELGQELVDSLFSGCAIAGPVAFLVLVASTRNIILAVIAVISVGSIVMCVLGFCKSAMDWDLGIGEAIAGVIVIGYSVDYVVHLAHIYREAAAHGKSTREERAAFAVQNMGSTVFAGALTTAGSGVVMFVCYLTFFFKMALLICMTIVFSFLFSMGFFMSIVFMVGPEGRTGDLTCHVLCCRGRRRS